MYSCAYCHAPATAFVCSACGFNRARKDDLRGSTATQLSKVLQRRVDSAAAYEQMSTLWSTLDPGVFPIDGDVQRGKRTNRGIGISINSRKIRKINQEANFVSNYRDFYKVKLPGKHPWKKL